MGKPFGGDPTRPRVRSGIGERDWILHPGSAGLRFLNAGVCMTIEQLSTLHHSQPFQPFRIHMADGRSLDVDHPDFLSRSASGRTAIVHKRNETFEIIDLLLVASVETLNGRLKPSS
jgi:hypothetical protein